MHQIFSCKLAIAFGKLSESLKVISTSLQIFFSALLAFLLANWVRSEKSIEKLAIRNDLSRGEKSIIKTCFEVNYIHY